MCTGRYTHGQRATAKDRDDLFTSANNWWLRSANSATNVRNVNNNGNFNNNNASNTSYRPRPASTETYDLEARERRPPLKTRY